MPVSGTSELSGVQQAPVLSNPSKTNGQLPLPRLALMALHYKVPAPSPQTENLSVRLVLTLLKVLTHGHSHIASQVIPPCATTHQVIENAKTFPGFTARHYCLGDASAHRGQEKKKNKGQAAETQDSALPTGNARHTKNPPCPPSLPPSKRSGKKNHPLATAKKRSQLKRATELAQKTADVLGGLRSAECAGGLFPPCSARPRLRAIRQRWAFSSCSPAVVQSGRWREGQLLLPPPLSP